GVAEEAGVGRPAIYRRYENKSELVLAAIAFMRARVPAPDTGDTRKDLITHLEMGRRRFDLSLIGTLLVEESKHPELLEGFRERQGARRRAQGPRLLPRRQLAHGQLRGALPVHGAARS